MLQNKFFKNGKDIFKIWNDKNKLRKTDLQFAQKQKQYLQMREIIKSTKI